jgi:putative endonuclease
VSDKIQTGAKGESLAAEFLKKKGFEIVARNYRHWRSEIDLIVRRDDWLIFVEVKTRTSIPYGHPEEFVDYAKARQIFQAAEEFIFSTNWQGHIRFDIISVTILNEREPEIEHFEDAMN